jgi:5-oxopent-3-ene-1,2,5-tricarboxylate decarboxylase/2-hydroxyhepta-2,4-diene-1,7-dioate isomerase
MQTPNTPTRSWQPQGTVYGTLLNFRREWDLWLPRMTQDPYKAAPKAPVLYVKTANTFSPAGHDLLLQDGVNEVEIGATLGLVMGDQGHVAGAVLLNDWSVPHASYYRPPIKFRCRDGYLALPSQTTACQCLSTWNALEIEVRLNDAVVQQVRLSSMVRDMATLLADVGEFMSLQPGDVLMLGTDCLPDGTRPKARHGDRILISAPGFVSLQQTVRLQGGAA